MIMEAIRLREVWAVLPEGRMGTCGWSDGEFWEVVYVKASSPNEALRKAAIKTAKNEALRKAAIKAKQEKVDLV
jgi:hypothetical protein